MPIDWVPKDMISQEEGPISVFVSEEEYLGTVYRPECDYIDGRLTDRNVGAYRVDAEGMHRVWESELVVPGTAMRLSVAHVLASE